MRSQRPTATTVARQGKLTCWADVLSRIDIKLLVHKIILQEKKKLC
jgi:hypothetical protein